MRPLRRLSLDSMCVAVLTLSMALSSCGSSHPAPSGHATPAGTTTAGPTATPPPRPTLSLDDVIMEGCPAVEVGPVSPRYSAVGNLSISIPQRYTPLDFPDELMPNGTPNAPYQIPASAVTSYRPNPPVNPSLETGYVLQVCNQTSVRHTVTSLSVTIASFIPSSGPVTVWHICQDGPYDTATKYTTGGCGGAVGQVDMLAATLPSDSTGASAPAIVNPRFGGAPLPIALGPNKSIELLIAVNGLTSQGTYALRFGASVDGAAPVTMIPSDGAFLIAPAPRVWTGTACQSPAMQAQIPASTQDTYYVCPPAS